MHEGAGEMLHTGSYRRNGLPPRGHRPARLAPACWGRTGPLHADTSGNYKYNCNRSSHTAMRPKHACPRRATCPRQSHQLPIHTHASWHACALGYRHSSITLFSIPAVRQRARYTVLTITRKRYGQPADHICCPCPLTHAIQSKCTTPSSQRHSPTSVLPKNTSWPAGSAATL